MNKYIIPICRINDSKIYNLTISARSEQDCESKIMQKYSHLSEADDWENFLNDLDKNHDILIGEIQDVELL